MPRFLVLALLVCALGGPLSGPARAQQASFPRAPDGTPDLSGVWQAINAANFNLEPHAASAGATDVLGALAAVAPGIGVVEGGTIPYRPDARAERDRNFANRRTDDPEAKCFRTGIPRSTYLPHPFQIFQTPTEIFVAYQYAKASRSIHMTNHMSAPVDGWMGWSNGSWEGDTLVVEVTGLNANWLDRAGNFFSENVRVVERYTPIDASHLQYEATIEDPTVFERPWKISMPLYRRIEPNAQLLEFKCVEFAEELMYGHLSKSAAQSEGSSGDE